MRTGEYIAQQYEDERRRILQEIEDVKPALMAEKEIIALQSETTDKNEGCRNLFFWRRTENRMGSIEFRYHANKKGYIFWTLPLAYIENGKFYIDRDAEYNLKKLPMKDLKKIHPKTWAEDLRHAAKELLLGEEDA